MEYQWDSGLETGYATIDNHHKQLIACLNNLVDAYRNGKSQNEVEKTLDFLTSYTIKHFMDEEKLMHKTNYPAYLIHRTYHEEFKKTVSGYTNRLKTEGLSDNLVEMILKGISDWLFNHIRGEDFVLATYIKSKTNF